MSLNQLKGFCITICLLYISILSPALGNNNKDTISTEKKYTFGVLPAIAYDSDLGFQYGALANIYLHSKNNRYPNYDNSIYLEASKFTAGSSMLKFYIDSKTAIKKVRTNLDVTYLRHQANNFLGFNGAKALYNNDFENEASTNYISRMFYKYDTRMFSVILNLKGNISQTSLYWTSGLTISDYKTKPVDIAALNSKKNENQLSELDTLLYSKYVEWEVLDKEEINGGFNTQMRLGFGIDTRNFESNPTSGIYSEILLTATPQWASTHKWGNMQLTGVHRHYISLVNKKTIFGYRLMAHFTPFGRLPYYLTSTIPTSWQTSNTLEGLGGSRTLRGVKRNRVIGDGFALANIEIRQRLIDFNIKGQSFYLATNIFADGGRVIQYHDINLSKVPENERQLHFSDQPEVMHYSYGLGLKILTNVKFKF